MYNTDITITTCIYVYIYTIFYYHYIYITILTVIQKRIPSFPKASSGTSALREMLRRRVPKPRGKRRHFCRGVVGLGWAGMVGQFFWDFD